VSGAPEATHAYQWLEVVHCACTQDSLAAVESALRRLGRLMPGYDLQAGGRLLELHLWQNFVSCLEEARS
jgi:hypothetical protein